MGAIHAEMVHELGYDPDVADGLVEVHDLPRVPVGEIRRARDGAREVAVARLASGKLVVVDDQCPHDGGRISDGFVDGERLVCARHNWEFDVRGGACVRRVGHCKPRE
ncbi:MAG: Rieske 2Fe-2S domain-containing protein [Kofleriaceae bacterium]